ncbi:MAG: hypothetical protein HOP03_14055 [Lysobacter sp.]|nr:hypothetical protein [Lysobacter sp.]
MSLTLGLTGMDQATEAALKAAFSEVNERFGRWKMVGEGDADYVIVDMDSMYGPMSWLRLHAAGKRVIGLTSSPRTQADFLLQRPFNAHELTTVLGEIDGTPVVTPSSAPPARPAPPPLAASPPAPAPEPPPAQAAVPVVVPLPAAAAPEAPHIPPPVVQQPSVASTPAMAPAAAAAIAEPASFADEPAAQTMRNTAFAHWLRPGALTGRARYQGGKGPEVFIDFTQRQYHGPSTLKPLAEYFVANVDLRDFEQLDDQSWQTAIVALGAPLPLSRLQWLGGLLAGEGRFLPGYNPEGRFVLSKWPETEREYPRHFRIATAMMKGPSTVAEIAASSNVPAADVVDFINANLATGFAEQAGDGTAPPETGKSGGLLDRLRGR